MRNGGIGLIIGIVLGIVVGATVIAPRLAPKQRGAPAPTPPPQEIAKDLPKLLLPRPSVEMRMASAVESSMPIAGALARRFDRRIGEVSRGEMEIRFHEPGALAPVADLFEAVASGAVDAAFIAPGLVQTPIPALTLYGGFPFGPRNNALVAWLYAGGGVELLREITEARGVRVVVCGLVPAAAAGWFRKPVEIVADLRGMPIAINGLGAKVLNRLGARTQPFTLQSIKPALEAHAVDAVVFASPAIDRHLGLQNLLSNYYVPGWQQSPGILAVLFNAKQWKELRSTQRIQVETVCGDNVRDALAEGEATQYDALKALRADGTNLQRWPTAIRDELQRTWSQIVEEEGNADAEFRRVWTSINQFREEHAIWDGAAP
jgi:TRAP-type mannitol/chloroaromatic compound transport system, periplasmic component